MLAFKGFKPVADTVAFPRIALQAFPESGGTFFKGLEVLGHLALFGCQPFTFHDQLALTCFHLGEAVLGIRRVAFAFDGLPAHILQGGAGLVNEFFVFRKGLLGFGQLFAFFFRGLFHQDALLLKRLFLQTKLFDLFAGLGNLDAVAFSPALVLLDTLVVDLYDLLGAQVCVVGPGGFLGQVRNPLLRFRDCGVDAGGFLFRFGDKVGVDLDLVVQFRDGLVQLADAHIEVC